MEYPVITQEQQKQFDGAVVQFSKLPVARITNAIEADLMSKFLKAVKDQIKSFDDLRLAITRPIMEYKEGIDQKFKDVTNGLDIAKKAADAILIDWSVELERRAQAERAKAAEEARKESARIAAETAALAERALNKGNVEAAESLMQMAENTHVAPRLVVVQKTKGTGIRTYWKADETKIDMKLLPDYLKIPNIQAINQIGQSSEGKELPGVIWLTNKSTVSR